MNLKEMFDAVNALDVDNYGYVNIEPGHAIMYRYHDRTRFDVIDAPSDGEYKEYFLVLNEGTHVECIPVRNGNAVQEDAKKYNLTDDVMELPWRIVHRLRDVGVL